MWEECEYLIFPAYDVANKANILIAYVYSKDNFKFSQTHENVKWELSAVAVTEVKLITVLWELRKHLHESEADFKTKQK